MAEETHRLTESKCPSCGYPMDAAANIQGESGGPEPGDASICMSCGAWLEFTEDNKIELMSAEAAVDLSFEQRSIPHRARESILARGLMRQAGGL